MRNKFPVGLVTDMPELTIGAGLVGVFFLIRYVVLTRVNVFEGIASPCLRHIRTIVLNIAFLLHAVSHRI